MHHEVNLEVLAVAGPQVIAVRWGGSKLDVEMGTVGSAVPRHCLLWELGQTTMW